MGIPSSCLNSQSINFQRLPFTKSCRRIQKFLALINIPIQTTWTITRTRVGKKTNPWYSALSTSDTTGSSNCFAIVSVEYQSGVCSIEVFWVAGFEVDFPCTLFVDGWEPIQRRTPWTALFSKSLRFLNNQGRIFEAIPRMWTSMPIIMSLKWTMVHVFCSFPMWWKAWTYVGQEQSLSYPGSFRVLFMEYAKCLPSDVNNKGR